MQRSYVMGAVIIGAGLFGITASAADPGVNLKVRVLDQKVAVQVATGNPTVIAVKARGPVNATLRLQSHSGSCVALVEEIAPGVCVPGGPGGPVSPN